MGADTICNVGGGVSVPPPPSPQCLYPWNFMTDGYKGTIKLHDMVPSLYYILTHRASPLYQNTFPCESDLHSAISFPLRVQTWDAIALLPVHSTMSDDWSEERSLEQLTWNGPEPTRYYSKQLICMETLTGVYYTLAMEGYHNPDCLFVRLFL